MNRHRLVALAAALAVASGARADTVQVSSTTMLLGRQDFRDGSLQTAVPLYELLDLDASGVKTSFADFEIALSTWGSADLGDVRFWQNGAQVGRYGLGYGPTITGQHCNLHMHLVQRIDGSAALRPHDVGDGECSHNRLLDSSQDDGLRLPASCIGERLQGRRERDAPE